MKIKNMFKFFKQIYDHKKIKKYIKKNKRFTY